MARRKGASLSQQISQLRGIVGAAHAAQLREPVSQRGGSGAKKKPLQPLPPYERPKLHRPRYGNNRVWSGRESLAKPRNTTRRV